MPKSPNAGGRRSKPVPIGRPKFGHALNVPVPAQLLGDLALARSLTGEGTGEFVRRAVRSAVDDVVTRAGVFLWARPKARVWRLETGPDGGPEGARCVLLAECAGGERVHPLERVFPLPEECGEAEGWRCDIAPDATRPETAGLCLRDVLVVSSDVLPRHPGVVGGYARRARVVSDSIDLRPPTSTGFDAL